MKLFVLFIGLLSVSSQALESAQGALRIPNWNDPWEAENHPAWNPDIEQNKPWSLHLSRIDSTKLPVGPSELRNQNLLALGIRHRYFGVLARASFDKNGIFLIDTLDSTVASSALFHKTSQPSISVFSQSKFGSEDWDFAFLLESLYQIENQTEFLMANDPAKGRVKAKAKPVLRPVLGVQYQINSAQSISLKYSESVKSSVAGDLDTNVPIGSFVSINYLASFGAKPLFRPRSLRAQWENQLTSDHKIGAALEYAHWSDMPAPYLSLSRSVPYLSLWVPNFRAKNTWSLSTAYAYSLKDTQQILASLGIEQSPFVHLKNYFYDDDALHLGLGYRKDFWHLGSKLTWHASQKQAAPMYFLLTLGLVN